MSKFRIIIISVALALVLVGCGGGAFGGITAEQEVIDDATVTQTIGYFDQNGDVGPDYTFTVTVPEAWVDNFVVTNNGAVVTFNYVDDGRLASIFSIQALSRSQYWEQIGSYPGVYRNVKAQDDTFFVYNLPQDAFYSGLDAALFEELSASVPEIVATFALEDTFATMSVAGTN